MKRRGLDQIKIVLLDGYLDEPSCLGVPPYISPQIRYVYGALLELGIQPEQILYRTIDQVRQDREENFANMQAADLVIVIAGANVPGRYLGGRPISRREIAELSEQVRPARVILGGPIVLSGQSFPEVDFVCDEIAAASVQEYIIRSLRLEHSPVGTLLDYQDCAVRIANWARLGAAVTTQHPNYPYIVCELETFRGCPRQHNCAFCSEARKRVLYSRPVEDVISEVEALYQHGNRYFRLGCQTDLFLYGAVRKDGALRIQPQVLKDLYQGIREVAPKLRVLHMDNCNPATLMRDPDLAAEAIEIIAKYNTAGDVAAFGLESADPQVLQANLVETNPEETLAAIRLMNEVGGWRENGVPKLLPGINLLHGLIGERKETMELNYAFLMRILDEGLMVRRINIRQVLPFGNYKAKKVPPYRFQAYKDKVNENINRPMLQRVFPTGTYLAEVHIEKVQGTTSFGRQLGSYPILVGIPGEHQIGEIYNVRVIDHGYRSITALPDPFYINRASIAELEALPGMGRKRATAIFLAQPISGPEHLRSLLEGQVDLEDFIPWFDFSPADEDKNELGKVPNR